MTVSAVVGVLVLVVIFAVTQLLVKFCLKSVFHKLSYDFLKQILNVFNISFSGTPVKILCFFSLRAFSYIFQNVIKLYEFIFLLLFCVSEWYLLTILKRQESDRKGKDYQ